ncbi:MAG: hypothetical protein ABL957_15400 [Parvularculaceae bacterium]
MRPFLTAFGVIGVAFAYFEEAAACGCLKYPDTVEKYFAQSDVVFRGRVVSTRWVIARDQDKFELVKSAEFEIQTGEGLKGIPLREGGKQNRFVHVRYWDKDEAACGTPFHLGVRYQVFAEEREGNFYTNFCMGTVLDESPPPWSWKKFEAAAGKE